MNEHVEKQPLPLYGLAGSFPGDRWIEAEGWDQRTVVHRLADMQGMLTVGVDRRTTAHHGSDAREAPIPADLARLGMATALVVDLPHVGDDVFEIAARVARDDGAWKTRTVKVDDEILTGYEREYEGMWVVYCLTTALILYVLAPVALRPDVVELRGLRSNEVMRRGD